MKAEDGTNKTPILTGIFHPPKAKPHVKRKTVLYRQPILTSRATLLPLKLCSEHPDSLTYCGCALGFFGGVFSARNLWVCRICSVHPGLSVVYVAEDLKSICIVLRATHCQQIHFDTQKTLPAMWHAYFILLILFCRYKSCHLFSFSFFWSCARGKMARHLPGYPVGGRCQATDMPIRLRPISGRVCGLELTDNTDQLAITDTTTLQAAGMDYLQGWNTFNTCNDNGKSCLAVVFCTGKKKRGGSLSSDHCRLPFSILRLRLYPSDFRALPLKPSWES